MAGPKPIIVESISCGHPVYTQGGKDVRAVTGGTRNAAIEAAKAKVIADGLCPAGIDAYTVVSERAPVMTTIYDSDSHYEMKKKVMNASAGVSGDKCYIVTLSVFCTEKLSIPKPVTTPPQPSSPAIQIHERGTNSVAPGTAPVGSGRKGPWKGPAKSL